MKRIIFFFIALSLFASTAWGGTSWWNSPVGQMFSYGGVGNGLLLEQGGFLLLEQGGFLLIEG